MSRISFEEFAESVVLCLKDVENDYKGETFDFVAWCERLDSELYDEWLDRELEDSIVWDDE